MPLQVGEFRWKPFLRLRLYKLLYCLLYIAISDNNRLFNFLLGCLQGVAPPNWDKISHTLQAEFV